MESNNEVMQMLVASITEGVCKGAWEKISKFFKDLNAKDAIRYQTAYEKYLYNTRNKYSKIKTLIYRHTPKDLYSFYESIGVDFGGEIVDTSNINNLIEVESKIIITGLGGMGKSILFKHLFLNTMDVTSYIPILIELRGINILDDKNILLKDIIYETLVTNGFILEKEYFEQSLISGAYVILLDGLDEVNRDKIPKVTSEIRHISDKYRNNKFIISSRPMEDFIGWNDYVEMQSINLTKEQALNLVKKIEFDEKIKDVFYAELDNNLFFKYQSFASNPLLLNIMLLTFSDHASIPNKLNHFYEMAFSTLFNMHDATKEAYVRDIRTGLSYEDFKLIFSHICFKSFFKYEYEFSEVRLREVIQETKGKFENILFTVENFIDDLTMSICMLVKDGLNYRFVHRSFQEYFAAWYTCKLTDDIQQKLLSTWLKESNTTTTDSYFTMLFNIQSEKVNKIVFIPVIKEIKLKLEKKGFGLDFLKDLFEGIVVERHVVETEEKLQGNYFAFSLRIKERYYCNALILTCKLNNYPYTKIPDKGNVEVGKKLYRLQSEKKKPYLSFEEVLEVISEKDMLATLSWFEKHLDFTFELLLKYDINVIGRKKKVITMIDEL